MLWCLAEALSDRHRKHMHDVVSVCLSQDVRAGRLLVRASTSRATSERQKFVLGCKPMGGTDAYALVEATRSCIDRFCTPRAQVPHYGRMKPRCQPPGGLPQHPGGLPQHPGGLPHSGGLPQHPGGLPQHPDGLPQPPGSLPQHPGSLPGTVAVCPCTLAA